jgi:hypothetical protein
LGKGAAACEVAGRGILRQCLSYKPLPAPSRWEGIAQIPMFYISSETPVGSSRVTAETRVGLEQSDGEASGGLI